MFVGRLMEKRFHQQARPEQIPFACEETRTETFMGGRGTGKLVALDTPIATPNGFRTMGDLWAGDIVYACDGTPTHVTSISEIVTPEKTYRVFFSDGTHIDACSDHQWITWEHRDRKSYLRNGNSPLALPEKWWEWDHVEIDRWGHTRENKKGPIGPKTRTTQEIFETLKIGLRGDRNHSIPTAAPLFNNPREFEIDPYLLGYWLGDGGSKSNEITIHIDDCDELTEKLSDREESFLVKDSGWRRHVNIVRVAGLTDRLKALGVHDNKHAPHEYLWTDEEQRSDFLAGLLDSDGYTSGKTIEFSNTNKDLALAVYHLAASLGQKPMLSEGIARLYGKDCGPKYRVTWRPTRQCFKLNRKARKLEKLLTDGRGQAHRHLHRMIVDVQEIDPVPMKCITVAHESHTYLVGYNMVPTHNSWSGANWVAVNCLTRPGLKAAILSPSYTAGWDTCLFGAKSGLLTMIPDKSLFDSREKKYIVNFKNGSSIRVFSSEQPTHMRGPEFHILWVDEMADLAHGMKCWNIIRPAVRLRHEDGIPAMTYVTGTPEAKELVIHLVDKVEGSGMIPPDPRYGLRTGRSIDNAANLDEDALADLLSTFEGTRYHKEQLEGVLLREAANALWSMDTIGACQRKFQPITFETIAIGVDPALSSDKAADETGIIAGGAFIDNYNLTRHPGKRCAAILADWSRRQSPLQWFRELVKISEYHGASTWVYEKNLAGPLIRDVGQKVLDETGAAIKLVPVHASSSKQVRAEPVAALYEAGRIIHMHDPAFPQANLDKLEAQMTRWEPTEAKSPDRIDALVWLCRHLIIRGGAFNILRAGDVPWGKK